MILTVETEEKNMKYAVVSYWVGEAGEFFEKEEGKNKEVE